MALEPAAKSFSWGAKTEKKLLISIKIIQVIAGEKFPCETIELESVEAGKTWLFDLGYVKLPSYIPSSLHSGYTVDFWRADRLVLTYRLTKPFPT